MPAGEIFRRRHLPHWDVPGAIYFVTTCLKGSIPALGLLDVRRYRQTLQERASLAGASRSDWIRKQWKLKFARTDDWLDHRSAVRHFADPRLASVVVDALFHFAGKRYDLWAYVVMPSHLHWVFRPRDDWGAGLERNASQRTPRERIMHTLKLHTSLECNRIRGAQGPFWQDESYDHCVFDLDELERIIQYIEWNPVRAGLADAPEHWTWSSAADRTRWGLPTGHPLQHPPTT